MDHEHLWAVAVDGCRISAVFGTVGPAAKTAAMLNRTIKGRRHYIRFIPNPTKLQLIISKRLYQLSEGALYDASQIMLERSANGKTLFNTSPKPHRLSKVLAQ